MHVKYKGLSYLSLKKKVSPLIWATASNTTGSEQMSMGVTGPWVGGRGWPPPALIPGVGTQRGHHDTSIQPQGIQGLVVYQPVLKFRRIRTGVPAIQQLVATWSKRLHSWLGCDLGRVSREGDPWRKKLLKCQYVIKYSTFELKEASILAPQMSISVKTV